MRRIGPTDIGINKVARKELNGPTYIRINKVARKELTIDKL